MPSLKDRVCKHFKSVAVKSDLTLGVEHEFFLMNEAGRVVSHEESQQFFESIAITGQSVFSNDPFYGRYLSQVEYPDGCVVKFDHHPFLFEITTPPAHDVLIIRQRLESVMGLIFKAAAQLRYQVSHEPMLPFSTALPETRSQLAFHQNLIDYRKRLFEKRDEPVDESLVNYAAGIIATQVHIGGVPFDQYDALFPLLYKFEMDTIFPLVEQLTNRPGVMQQREALYRSVFKNSPVVCTPSFLWSVENWLNGLLETPLYGSREEYFAGGAISDYPELDAMDEQEFLFRVRDLQWIKPHRQGTIEFRSAAASPDIDSIIVLCDTRLKFLKSIL